MDLPDIEVIVQYKTTCDLCALWQRFGRAARGEGKEATAILLVEKKDTEDERKSKAERAAKRKEKKKEGIGTKRGLPKNQLPRKRIALSEHAPSQPNQNQGDGGEEENSESSSEEELDIVEELDENEERRAHYARRDQPESTAFKAKRTPLVVGSALDDFINAAGRVKCRRVVLMLYFGNDKTRECSDVLDASYPILTPSNNSLAVASDDHKHCDQTSPTGCARCAPRINKTCCDICSPLAFNRFHVDFTKSTRSAAKSYIKKFEMDPSHRDLRTALVNWREETALRLLKPVLLQTYGAKVFMSDEIIDRLVVCAPTHKLTSPLDIVKETGWRKDWAEKHGDALISTIHTHFPLPVALPAAPLSDLPLNSSVAGPTTTRKRRTVRCSKCNEEGHNSKYINRPRLPFSHL